MSVNQEVKTTVSTDVRDQDKLDNYIDRLKELIRTGQMMDAQTKTSGREFMAQHQNLTALTKAYMVQNSTLDATGMAFGSLGRNVNVMQNMFMQYNIMQIRLIATQDQVIQSQYAYNQAVLSFGPTSQQARLSLDRLHIAQKQQSLAQLEYNIMIAMFIIQVPGMIQGINQTVSSFRTLFALVTRNTSAIAANTVAQIAGASAAVGSSGATVAAQTAEGGSVVRLTGLYRALGIAKSFAMSMGPWGLVAAAGITAAAIAAPTIMQAMQPEQSGANQQLQTYAQARSSAGTTYDMKNINFYGDISVKDPMEVSKVMDRVGKGFREGGAAAGLGHDMSASTGG